MTPNFPLNCWYVAATSDEIGRTPLARRLLDRPVVLYRDQSGNPVALADRCVHRGYPLSKGRLDGDELVCGYHGLRYDTSGGCVRVPSQPHVPYGACVEAYAVRERPPFVWIWLGDERRSAIQPLPELPWVTTPGWSHSGTSLRLAANFMLVHEHYLDLTHIPEVHPQETPPGLDTIPPLDQIRVSETSATYTRTLPRARLADWEAETTGLSRELEYDRRHHGEFISPAVLAEGWDIEAGDGRVFKGVRVHAVTPETTETTHLFWRVARNWALDRAIVGEHLHKVFEQVLRRDTDVIETVQACVGYEGAAAGMHVTADAAVLRVRAIVQGMVAAEAGRRVRVAAAPRSATDQTTWSIRSPSSTPAPEQKETRK